MNPELKPCPFCGENNNLFAQRCEGTIIHPAYLVCCDNRGASTGYVDKDNHVDNWNRRVPAEPVSDDRQMLLKLMGAFDIETWQCPSCGHAEDTATMDSANMLRDYLKDATVAEPVKMPSDDDILEIAKNPICSPCSPWWLKDGVKISDVRQAAIVFARALLAKYSEQPSKCSEHTGYAAEDMADQGAQAFRDGLNAALKAAQDARDSLPLPQYHGASRCVAVIKELIESAKK